LQETLADAKAELPPLIVESNSLLQFLRPSLYFSVVDPAKEDFKDSARVALDRADALVVRGSSDAFPSMGPAWMKLPSRLLREKPSVSQREGEPCLSRSACSCIECWRTPKCFDLTTRGCEWCILALTVTPKAAII